MSRAKAIRGLILPGVLSLAGLAVLISLGNWQMQRLAWKEDLIARISARTSEPTQPLPPASTWPSFDIGANEYRSFSVRGRFQHRNEVHVYTVLSEPKGSFSGAGYWVMTPFESEDGGLVIVNRGFVPQELKDPASRNEGKADGVVRITGLLRAPEPGNFFTPANDPFKKIFYRRGPADISRVLNLRNVAPFLLDVTGEYRPDMLPQPNETKLTFTNNHLGYALTWYGLACTLIGVFSAFAWQRINGTAPDKS